MRISHLQHRDGAIQCSECGAEFEIRSKTLLNPHRLLEAKESIAERHDCTKAVAIVRPKARVWQMPVGREQLSDYFDREIARIWGLSAESGTA